MRSEVEARAACLLRFKDARAPAPLGTDGLI